jgi:hypothetical protein
MVILRLLLLLNSHFALQKQPRVIRGQHVLVPVSIFTVRTCCMVEYPCGQSGKVSRNGTGSKRRSIARRRRRDSSLLDSSLSSSLVARQSSVDSCRQKTCWLKPLRNAPWLLPMKRKLRFERLDLFVGRITSRTATMLSVMLTALSMPCSR